jgi:hypothetical protein
LLQLTENKLLMMGSYLSLMRAVFMKADSNEIQTIYSVSLTLNDCHFRKVKILISSEMDVNAFVFDEQYLLYISKIEWSKQPK